MSEPVSDARVEEIFNLADEIMRAPSRFTKDFVVAELVRGVAELAGATERARAELAAATARAEAAEAIVARVTNRMTEYGSGMVNVRQVLNLLSPTWPDGNYSDDGGDRG